jgi:hypothetical protein
MRSRSSKGGKKGQAGAEAVHVVRRRCTVCDWEAQLVERGSGDDPLCPWCYGATERTSVVGVVIPETAGAKDSIAAALGRRGGLKGGPARAQKLSAKRRHEIAARAAKARWGQKKKPKR